MDIFAEKRCESKVGVKEFVSAFVGDVKEQFEDHLQAINENTNEIEANHEFLCALNSKMDKLSERLEKIELFLGQNTNFELEVKHNYTIKPLSTREKEVFLMLYTLEEAKGNTTYLDISRRTGLTEDLVSGYVTALIEKGVPIQKRYINGKAFLRIESHFKTMQAKHNILKIEQKLISQMF